MSMKGRLILTVLLALICMGTVHAYEARLSGVIALQDKIDSMIVSEAAGKAVAASRSGIFNIVDISSSSIAQRILANSSILSMTIDSRTGNALVLSPDGTLNSINLLTGQSESVFSLVKGSGTSLMAAVPNSNTVLFAVGSKIIATDLTEGTILFESALPGDITRMIAKDNQILVLVQTRIDNVPATSLYDIDLRAGKVSERFTVTGAISDFDFDSERGMTVLAINGKLLKLDRNYNLLHEFELGGSPTSAAISTLSGVSVVADTGNNVVYIIDLQTDTVVQTISIFKAPGRISIDQTRNMALLSHQDGLSILSLENPLPEIDKLVPDSAIAGSSGLTLSIYGKKFMRDTRAGFNGYDTETIYDSSISLKAEVPSSRLQTSSLVPVQVTNSGPGGGASNSLYFRIMTPMPRIESITPISVPITEKSTGLLIRGRNFMPSSYVTLNGSNLTTRFVSSILLEADAGLSALPSPAKYPVNVVNAGDFTLTSNTVFLDVVDSEVWKAMSDSSTQNSKLAKDQPTGSLKGKILDTNKRPIEGVELRIRNSKTRTDNNGLFLLSDVPAGRCLLMVDGSTVPQTGKHHPTIPLTVNIEPNTITEMPFQIYLHEQKSRNFKEIEIDEDTVLTDPEVPGCQLTIPKGVKIAGWDGKFNRRVSIRTVPRDRLPVKPLPANAFVKTVYMFYFDKKGGGKPDRPVPFKSPNDLGLLPGEKATLWYYDESPNEGEAPNDWAIAGTGTVSADGRFIETDPGIGIPKFCCGATTWGSEGAGQSNGPNGGCGSGQCCSSGGMGPSGTAGDPVDIATGYFIHSKTDLVVPGVIPVNISRYYRSAGGTRNSFGINTYFEYDWWVKTSTDMVRLVKPGNYHYNFAKQANGTYVNTTDPAMRNAIITSTSDGKVLRMADGWKYTFNSFGYLTEVADRNNNKITITRMEMDYSHLPTPIPLGNYISEITTSEGKKITFRQQYIGSPQDPLAISKNYFRIDEIVAPDGRSVKYEYEMDFDHFSYRIKKVIYPDGSSIQYGYDSLGRMTSIVNESGVTELINQYDDSNRVITQTHADGGVYTFSYNSLEAGGYSNETTMTGPNNSTTVWRLNSLGFITDKTTLDGATVWNLDPSGNHILSVTDPLSRQMTYTYDSKGRVDTKTDNGGNSTSYVYEDIYNNITSITDAMSRVTDMDYDSMGNLITITAPDLATTTFEHNSKGQTIGITDSINNKTVMQYDALGNLNQVTDPLSNSTTMTYDKYGNLLTVTDPGDNTTQNQYDIMGRALKIIDPKYAITKYSYTLDGKLSSVTDAKQHTISYEYDNRGRVSKMTDQLGRYETYTYDTSDNVHTYTDRKGQTNTYIYDALNRMTRATYQDGTYTDYAYDVTGKVLSITDSVSGAISYTYAGTGCSSGCTMVPDKIVQETSPQGTINYAYDAIGRRSTMNVQGQPVVNYSYDTGGRLSGIDTTINSTAAHFGLGYDQAARRSTVSLPNGVLSSYSYDNGNRMLSLTHKNSANQVLEALTYAYDNTGNRTSMNRQVGNSGLPAAVTGTSYNEANHMLTFTPQNETAKNMTYDNNGNVTSLANSCGMTTFTWDVKNRLTGISGYTPGCTALAASFKYDALGRRIEKTINSRTIKYLYDGIDIVQEIENASPTANYIRTSTIDEPLARIQTNGVVRYYQAEALGSVVALTDETGAVKTTYSYDPFGNTTVSGEASDNPFQYTGRENDGTGLYYYRARYYSPALQRFIGEDPIGIKGGINKFSYVANDPINTVDPAGLEPRFGLPPAFWDWWHGEKQAEGGRKAGDHLSKGEALEKFGDWVDMGEPRGKGGKSGKGGQCRGGAGIGGCFTEDTVIVAENGFKPINAIELGDKVLTKNESTGVKEYKRVEKLFRQQTEELVELTIGSEVIRVTQKHRFFIKDKGWTEATAIQKGDAVESANDGEGLLIDDINKIALNKPLTVYNMEIKDNHNYYVSDKMVLAHNLKEMGADLRMMDKACFTGETLIQTHAGVKSIKEIQLGDEVKTINKNNWAIEYQPVVKKYGAEIKSYYKISIEKESLHSTENHRYWVPQRGWTKARDLKVTDALYSENGVKKITAIELIISQKPVSVYNLEVINNDNYLVGSEGILVVDRWINEGACLNE